MQCVILAGGLGTRLGSLAGDRPKHLVPVAGSPFADHQLRWLATQDVTDVVYCIGHGGDAIRDFVGDGSAWGLTVSYVDDGATLLGTGGALRHARESGVLADWCFVTYGDSLLTLDLRAVADAFLNSSLPALMTVFENRGQFDTSNVWFEEGRIKAYSKEPDPELAAKMAFIDYGMLAFSRSAISELPPGQSDLATLCTRLADTAELAAYVATERFYEIGTPEGLAAASEWLVRIGTQ